MADIRARAVIQDPRLRINQAPVYEDSRQDRPVPWLRIINLECFRSGMLNLLKEPEFPNRRWGPIPEFRGFSGPARYSNPGSHAGLAAVLAVFRCRGRRLIDLLPSAQAVRETTKLSFNVHKMNESFQATRLLDLIEGVDSVPADFGYDSLYKLLLPHDTRTHGFLTPETVSKLPWISSFAVDHATKTVQVVVDNDSTSPTRTINAAFQSLIDGAIQLGTSVFPNLTSHSELVRIIGSKKYGPSSSNDSVICLERFAAPLFGICSRGAHLTAYVRHSDRPGDVRIWVARRGAHLHTYPGVLDTTVAGGVKATDTPLACILAESDEEASLPLLYVEKHVVPTGVVTYVTRSRKTGQVLPTILYVYDLELHEGTRPEPKDGEVEAFYLMTVDEVTGAMFKGEFKPNCCLVMLDFFVRHGIITEENERDYLEIVTRLRRRLPVPVAPEGR